MRSLPVRVTFRLATADVHYLLMEQTVEQHQKQLERMREEQKALEPDVERMQEREKLQAEVSNTS